jgi:DUF3089 family protein
MPATEGKLARMRRIVLAIVSVAACASEPSGDGGSESSGSTSSGAAETSLATSSSTNADTTSSESSSESSTGEMPQGYDDPALWLCHAEKPVDEDQCLSADLDATELLADGTTALVEHTVATDPSFDCFYIYPTVDIRFQPGQTENFDDISQELDPLLNQAARFTSMCRVYAPLYHQVTLGTFGSAMADELLDNAYQDVLAAFESWRDTQAGDRSFVLMGHSQGTFMTTRLLQEVIEPDSDLRDRMLAALLVGGSFSVPFGEVDGGTSTIPLCESADQLGCVIAYRSYAEDLPPVAGNQTPDIPGNDVACTSPPMVSTGTPRFAGGFFPTFTHQPSVFPVIDYGTTYDTPFVLMRDFYEGACMPDSDGLSFLAISEQPHGNDMRTGPIDFAQPLFNPSFLGLHVLDYNFAQQDLLDLVAAKAAAKGL